MPQKIVGTPVNKGNKIIGRRARLLLKASIIGGQNLAYLRIDRPEIEAMLVEIKPGGQSGRHIHPVPTLVYVIKGTLTVELDNGSRHKYPAGKISMEVTNVWHNARNMARKSLKLLVIYLGQRGKPNMLRPTI
jgi:quercetin dioxygenase-like cupin family protein